MVYLYNIEFELNHNAFLSDFSSFVHSVAPVAFIDNCNNAARMTFL